MLVRARQCWLFTALLRAFLLAPGSSQKFIPTFRYLCMVLPLNVVIVPLNVVVLGPCHEGLRVVLHSVIGLAAPKCDPCHRDETDHENDDPDEGAPDRRANSGGKAVVTSDEFGPVTGKLITWWAKTPFGLASHGAGST